MRGAFLLLLLGLGLFGCSRPGGVTVGPSSGVQPVDGASGPAEELARLKGSWSGSVLLGDAPGEDVTVEFTPEKVTFTRKGPTFARPYAIDPSKDPKWIDLKGSARSDPPMPSTYGIYEIDGDELKICMGNSGSRPTKFGGGRGTIFYRLKRR